VSHPVVVDRSLFADLDNPCLSGSRCPSCGTVAFPVQTSCPKCSSREVETVPLPRTGVLWSWTVQHFEPKAPFRHPGAEFRPYPIGYVDLGDVIVESRLRVPDGIVPQIGMRMSLTLVPAWEDNGTAVHTFAFRLDTRDKP
jgi:uncharacterized OB-fold protein